jgi:hypothetical protein
MVTTSTIASVMILVQFLVGGLLGLLIAGLVLRSKLNWWRGLATALVTGVVFEVVIGATSWASWHQGIYWTDRVAAHESLLIWAITICTAAMTALLINRCAAKQLKA